MGSVYRHWSCWVFYMSLTEFLRYHSAIIPQGKPHAILIGFSCGFHQRASKLSAWFWIRWLSLTFRSISSDFYWHHGTDLASIMWSSIGEETFCAYNLVFIQICLEIRFISARSLEILFFSRVSSEYHLSRVEEYKVIPAGHWSYMTNWTLYSAVFPIFRGLYGKVFKLAALPVRSNRIKWSVSHNLTDHEKQVGPQKYFTFGLFLYFSFWPTLYFFQ